MIQSHKSTRQPFQRLHLNLRPTQFTKCFLGGVQFEMSVRSAKGSFQFCEVLRAEQVIHPFPHFVAEFSALGQCLPRGREIFVPDGLHGIVDVVRNILCKLLHPPAAVKAIPSSTATMHRHA